MADDFESRLGSAKRILLSDTSDMNNNERNLYLKWLKRRGYDIEAHDAYRFNLTPPQEV